MSEARPGLALPGVLLVTIPGALHSPSAWGDTPRFYSGQEALGSSALLSRQALRLGGAPGSGQAENGRRHVAPSRSANQFWFQH